MPKGYANNPKTTTCPVCSGSFVQAHHSHVYCSRSCKREMSRTIGADTTQRQYARVSGNWARYYNRLRCRNGRQGLSLTDILALHERQRGVCALTGTEMTCELKKGSVCPTNASLDRIDPNGAYTVDNLQLVCAALNKFRINTSVEDFIDWCKKVAAHAVRE